MELDRHLEPHEIDLLLDGDVGFAWQPLRAHARRCERCKAELEAMREVVAQLEHVPHFAPAPRFADRVMAQVHVFEPAHVTAIETARRWLPRSRPLQVAASAAAFVAAFVVSALTLWVGSRVDLVFFFTNVVGDRASAAAGQLLGGLVAGALGQPGADAVRAAGPAGMVLLLAGFVLTAAAATAALRAAASVSSRRRS